MLKQQIITSLVIILLLLLCFTIYLLVYIPLTNKNYIDCTKGEIQIHIILEPNSINDIINNSSFISSKLFRFQS